MRLHEIADPDDYSLPDIEEKDIAKQIEKARPPNMADDAPPGSRRKSKTGKIPFIGTP